MNIDQLLNKALKKITYEYDEKRLDKAKKYLRDTLRSNDVPNYDDPSIVDAYLDNYHIQHCMLASWVFDYFFEQLGVPKALYVCDVGAGTLAGCIGLASALSKYKEKPAVYFDAYEPSDEMWNTGYCFWSAFRDSVGANFDPDPWSTLPHRLPDGLPVDATRVVTAFHLSLPYNNKWNENNIGEEARNSLEGAFRMASPEYGLFTCHKGKEDSLRRAIDNSYGWNVSDSKRKPCPSGGLSGDLPTDSILLSRVAKLNGTTKT